jgi:ATP-binding cassette subfamily B protein
MAEEKNSGAGMPPFRGPGAGHGPGAGPRGGFQKPKDTRRTALRLLGYLTHSKLPLVGVVLCLAISSVSSLAGSYLASRIIINRLVSGAYTSAGLLAADLLKLLIIYLCGVAATYGQSAVMARLAQKGANRLRRDLFDKLQELPLSYFDRHTHGELMSRFTNDADNVQMALEQSVVSLISSTLMFAGVVAVMLYVSPLLFLSTILTLTATFLVFKVFGGRSRKYYREQQRTLGMVNGNIQEIIEGLKVVKAFTHEKQAKAAFDELNEAYRSAATEANFYSSAIMPLSMTIMNMGYAVTAAFGGLMAIVAGFDLGGFVLFLNLSRQVSQPMSQISQQLTNLLSALAGAERIFAVMDQEPEVDEGGVTLVPARCGEDGKFCERTGAREHVWAWKVPQPDGAVRYVELKGDVRLHDVNFSYVEGEPVLKDVSVYAKPGQKIAFVGSTGAGKTTITNLLSRFYEIGSGSITYDGIDLRDIKKDSLRGSLGMVLQDTHLFTGTVMENIRYGRLDATDAECVAAAKSANAHSFIRRLPQGYRTMVTAPSGSLKKGWTPSWKTARCSSSPTGSPPCATPTPSSSSRAAGSSSGATTPTFWPRRAATTGSTPGSSNWTNSSR